MNTVTLEPGDVDRYELHPLVVKAINGEIEKARTHLETPADNRPPGIGSDDFLRGVLHALRAVPGFPAQVAIAEKIKAEEAKKNG